MPACTSHDRFHYNFTKLRSCVSNAPTATITRRTKVYYIDTPNFPLVALLRSFGSRSLSLYWIDSIARRGCSKIAPQHVIFPPAIILRVIDIGFLIARRRASMTTKFNKTIRAQHLPTIIDSMIYIYGSLTGRRSSLTLSVYV